MRISERIKKIKPGQKLVFCPSTVQVLMTGIAAVELYPDKAYIRVYQNGARVSAAMTEEHLNMADNAFNVFKFTGEDKS